MFSELRESLLVQREQISERLEAIDQAEAALERVRAVFGMPANGAPEAQGERPGLALAFMALSPRLGRHSAISASSATNAWSTRTPETANAYKEASNAAGGEQPCGLATYR